MNLLELHDSTLSSIAVTTDLAVLTLRPAIIHRCAGRPGIDAGTCWTQDAGLTIVHPSHSPLPENLPSDISDGDVRACGEIYRNGFPAPTVLTGAIELRLVLVTAEPFTVRGETLTVKLIGARKFLDNFPGSA